MKKSILKFEISSSKNYKLFISKSFKKSEQNIKINFQRWKAIERKPAKKLQNAEIPPSVWVVLNMKKAKFKREKVRVSEKFKAEIRTFRSIEIVLLQSLCCQRKRMATITHHAEFNRNDDALIRQKRRVLRDRIDRQSAVDAAAVRL